MDENETETQRIPSFTVLKNGSILKNIILLNKSSSQNQDEEQILLVGRHPHCNISLGHPSISRYHLRIHSNPQSHSISVIDLSSVHGTWVCGKRVKPGVYVTLKEGDTVKIGGSSRVYELHWVPVNTLNEPYDVYVIKEGEEGANQDEKDDTCSLDDDDMECLEWPLEDKVQDSPFKKLDPLICSVSEYLSSSGDDTEVEHSSSSNEGNKNGQIFSAVLDQPESVVVGTVSAVHDSNSMSELSNELEPQNDGVNMEDPVSELVVNCSKSTCDDAEAEHLIPQGTDGEIVDIFAPVSVQSPLVVSEGMSETEVSDSLNKSEDQLNWLRENVSNEFELQNHGINKEEPFSVLNCSKSPCYDTEEEHSSPKGTGNINGELLTAVSIQSPFVVSEAISEAEVSDSLDKSEDESNWLRDNISNEFEQFGYETMKEDLITVAVFDALNQDIARSDEINMGNVIEQVNEQEIDNWLRDNISNEFEQLGNGTVKDDMVSEDIKTCEKDASDKEIARNDEIDMGNENEALIQQEIDNGCVNGDDDGYFTPSREGGKDVNVGCVLEMNQLKTTDESASVILFDGMDNEVDISNEFGQLSHSAMKDDLLSVAPFDAVKMYEKDVVNQDVARSDEIEMGNQSELVIQQEIENGSISVALNDDVKGDEEEPFVADMAGAEEVNLGCEFEQMNKMNIMEESASVILFKGLDNEVDEGIKFELINDEMMKKKSVFEALPDGTDSDKKQTLTPVSRVKEVCMNLEAMMNGSVPTNLFDCLNENETELFTPDKENKNPEARSGKSSLKRWKKAVSPIVNEERDIFGFSKSLLTSVDESKNVLTRDEEKFVSTTLQQRSVDTTDKVDPFVYCDEEVLFSSEKETKSGQVEMEANCNSMNYPETVQKVIDSSQDSVGRAKRWIMVVDTSTLIHDESLKHLKLLKGLKGTQLFVPKIVIRELMDLKSQYAFYKSSTVKASLALQWIDELTVNTSWWIHMDDEILHSSQAETEVLQIALHLRKEITDGKAIILSNDLTLKIKAMAEGVMCEEAEEFRRSLVNPFSERFMWVGSSARGLTWSCVDDVVRNYHGCGLHGSHRLKGLRLLAHG